MHEPEVCVRFAVQAEGDTLHPADALHRADTLYREAEVHQEEQIVRDVPGFGTGGEIRSLGAP